MPSYAQWRNSIDKGQVAKVTWLCGDQRVLVEEVISETRKFLNVSEFDYFSFSGETDSLLAIWDSAYQYALEPDANRFILVRDAEFITEWGSLTRWFVDSKNLVGTYLMFVSNDADYPYVPDTKKPELAAHVELIRSKGKTVKCSLPNDEELIAWVKRNSNFSDMTAKFLIERAGSDLPTVMNVCKKSLMFRGDPGPQVTAQLTQEFAKQSFSDCLIFNNKKSALLELNALPESEYARVVGQLYSRLDVLHTLWKAVPNFNTSRELAEATGIKLFLVHKYGAIAKNYDPTRLTKCRNVLTVVDDAIQRHATAGAMELLVGLW